MLSRDWWIRFRLKPKVQKALARGFTKHCYEVVKKHLHGNEEFPTTFQSFWDMMRITRGPDYRRKVGDCKTTHEECLGYATILKIEPREFIPRRQEWLIVATQRLCGSKVDPESKGISLFVTYCLMQFEKGTSNNEWLGRWGLDRSTVAELKDHVESFPGVECAYAAIEEVVNAISATLEGKR